jgi:predicted PurR-regulated permease PerM
MGETRLKSQRFFPYILNFVTGASAPVATAIITVYPQLLATFFLVTARAKQAAFAKRWANALGRGLLKYRYKTLKHTTKPYIGVKSIEQAPPVP